MTRDRESTGLVKKVYDLWKVPTPERGSIFGPLTPEEIANALNYLMPGKSLGLDNIFKLHPGSALKSWLCDFFTSMHVPNQNSRDVQ